MPYGQELETHRVVEDTRQSKWRVRRTFVWDPFKMRVTIDHDPYEFQCDFYLEIFNPNELKWNRVHTESTDWARGFDALSTDSLTDDQWECINALIDHMVEIGVDLLVGVKK